MLSNVCEAGYTSSETVEQAAQLMKAKIAEMAQVACILSLINPHYWPQGHL